MKFIITSTILLIFFFTGCSQKEPIIPTTPPSHLGTLDKITKAKLERISFDDIHGFYEDDLSLAFEVFKKDCKKSKRYKLFKNICEKSKTYTNASEFFTTNFTPYKLHNNDGTKKGLITGYYEPLLHGSRVKTDTYKYPIYKLPKDLIIVDLGSLYPALKKYRLRGKIKGNRLVPYDTRKNINEREDLEAICYVDDEIDLFFLQIQGSGKVQLDSGEIINIGYKNQNGHKYFAIGRALVKDGSISKRNVSLQSIKKYLKETPSRVKEVLNKNRSYIFFHESKKSATGALGTQLVANRNLAVDRKFIPLGMPVFINTKNSVSKESINSLMVAADVGGAIKGQIRADFFFGNGENAELYAGGMKEKGTLTILVPKI
jgi:membrane-bound lytic murein transglycosylase A